MARDTPLGMDFVNWRSAPSITESFRQTSQGKFNPLLYAAGYALNALAGPSGFSDKMMGAVAPKQPALGQGLNVQPSPVVPPSGGLGLAQPSNFVDYQPKSETLTMQPIQQNQPDNQAVEQTMPVNTWSKQAFGRFMGGE